MQPITQDQTLLHDDYLKYLESDSWDDVIEFCLDIMDLNKFQFTDIVGTMKRHDVYPATDPITNENLGGKLKLDNIPIVILGQKGWASLVINKKYSNILKQNILIKWKERK